MKVKKQVRCKVCDNWHQIEYEIDGVGLCSWCDKEIKDNPVYDRYGNIFCSLFCLERYDYN